MDDSRLVWMKGRTCRHVRSARVCGFAPPSSYATSHGLAHFPGVATSALRQHRCGKAVPARSRTGRLSAP